MCARSMVLVWLAFIAAAAPALAQTRYELRTPQLERSSLAIVTEGELRIIDPNGRETVYLRDPTVDAAGGTYLAYRNSAVGQVIRWPAAGRGPMQLGTVRGGALEFRTSQMEVVPRDDRVAPPMPRPAQRPLPPAPPNEVPLSPDPAPFSAVPAAGDLFTQVWRGGQAEPGYLRLGVRDQRGQQWYLGHAGRRRLAMFPAGRTAQVDWFVVPAGRGYVRLQMHEGGDWLALAVTSRNTLALDYLAQDASQLWRVVRTNSGPAGFWLESAAMPGMAISGTPGGAVGLAPIGASWEQVWQTSLLPAAPAEPLWRSISHEVTPNAPLPPAQIDLLNSHTMPIVVLVGHRRSQAVEPVRVDPGGLATHSFERDAGASIVEVYETRSPGGVWSRQQFVTPIPPAILYDLSVYEEFVQSIAIDRTGTSPNPIEDISVLPKSVGMILVPPGTALPARGRMDVYAQARAANNPGIVRRWDPRTFDRPSTFDPIQEALQSVAPAASSSSPPLSPPPPPVQLESSDRQKF